MTQASSFKFIRKQTIKALDIQVSEYEHSTLGCKHYHLESDSDENVFLVAFKTIPQDSTGVAHILEHTTLCGSEKYPVRDPFFMMTRRSLNTFMNAFTASDWTAYPFATRNLKDFNNLLQVYLDAVFQPRLDPLDFAQEGHRIELEQDAKGSEYATYKGIVFNEMKGAMSSPTSVLYQKLCEYIFPTQTYHHNSGGEPLHIPDLSYEDLLAFHKKHYHPSNATFFTFGNIEAASLQASIETHGLQAFIQEQIQTTQEQAQTNYPALSVGFEKRYLAPIRVQTAYAAPDDADNSPQTYLLLAWLLPAHASFNTLLEYHFLSQILLANSASPLMKALETTNLGEAPAPLTRLHDSFKESVFSCGLQGARIEDAATIETFLLDTLSKIAETPIPSEDIEATLHQLEFSQREIRGDSYPFGLELILEALTPALHGQDVFNFLEIDNALKRLNQAAQDPTFIPKLINDLLLDNPHRVCLALYPEPKLNERKTQQEKAILSDYYRNLSQSAKDALKAKAQALARRQADIDCADQLPKVGLNDIPEKLTFPTRHPLSVGKQSWSTYKAGTNGIWTQKVVAPLPQLTDLEISHLDLLWATWTDMGTAGQDYLASQKRIDRYTGGIRAGLSIRPDKDDLNQFASHVTLSSKCLKRNHGQTNAVLSDYWFNTDFSDLARIKDLLLTLRKRLLSSITSAGHRLAIQTACSHLYPANHFSYASGGLPLIQRLKNLGDALKDPQTLTQIASSLKGITDKISQMPFEHLLITDQSLTATDLTAVTNTWTLPQGLTPAFSYDFERPESPKHIAWLTTTEVNFCAKAYRTTAASSKDVPALRVAASLLSNNFLHTKIREQGGAYGGGASYNHAGGCFSFYSYRDPRLSATLKDFDQAIDWLQNETISDQHLEEAILSIINGIDKPHSPAGEAAIDFYTHLYEDSHDAMNQRRKNIINVSKDEIKRAANLYLIPDLASSALITSKTAIENEHLTQFEQLSV